MCALFGLTKTWCVAAYKKAINATAVDQQNGRIEKGKGIGRKWRRREMGRGTEGDRASYN